jgi:hypothetical protein
MPAIDFHIDCATWVVDAQSPIHISGWCAWRDGRPLKRILARVGGKIVAEGAPIARDDVSAFLHRPSATLSGFHLSLPSLEIEEVVHLAAEDTEGRSEEFHAARAGDFPNKGNVILPFSPARTTSASTHPTALAGGVRFSILVPVYNTPAHLLRECVDSVLGQTFNGWELRLVDDGSDRAETGPVLAELAARDPRIHVGRLAQRAGISGATNQALARATGDYVVLLDHDDRLLPHALETLAQTILSAAPTNPDAIYSDEEKITETGELRLPVLKPAFSPEFFRGVMYVSHVVCLRRALVQELGGYDSAFDGIQDFEFFLRISEQTRRIVHIPEALYQWRISAGSSAQSSNVKGDMDSLQARAVETHLQRLGRACRVRALGNHRVTIDRPPGFARPPMTLIVTPDAAVSPVLRGLHDVTIEVGDSHGALSVITGQEAGLVGFLGELIVDASPEWLEDLAFLALDSEADRVSPVIRSVEGKVLESGRTLDSDGRTVPIMRGFDPTADGYNGSLRCHREVLLPSPVCWVACACADRTSRKRYNRVCATAWIRVARSWADPDPESTHHKGPFNHPHTDPFFNPAFDPHHGDYRLRRPH